MDQPVEVHQHVQVNSETPLDTLPIHLQMEVLSQVQWSARATCRTFCRHIEAGRVALRLAHHIPAQTLQLLEQSFPGQLLARLPQLRHISCRLTLSPATLSTVPTFSQLTSLDLEDSGTASNFSALTVCMQLRSQCISYACLHIDDISHLTRFSSLRKLQLTKCRRLVNLSPLAACTQLTDLDLTHGFRIVDVGPLAAVKALQRLDLSFCYSLADIHPLVACVCLHTLSLRLCRSLLDVGLLASCGSLRCLDLKGCSGGIDTSPLTACKELCVVW